MEPSLSYARGQRELGFAPHQLCLGGVPRHT